MRSATTFRFLLAATFVCALSARNAIADGLYVTSNGNIGIGTSTPGNYKLNVVGLFGVSGNGIDISAGSTNARLLLQSTTSTQYDQSVVFKDPGGEWHVGQKWQYTTNDFGIGRTGSKTDLIIYSSGQVQVSEGLSIPPLATANQALCTNIYGQLITCASSMRYKENVRELTDGLSIITKLDPVRFSWKKEANVGSGADVGFIAEDVAKVEPALAYANSKGEIEGVSYNRMAAYLVEAIQTQQREIQQLRAEVKALENKLAK